MTRALYDDGPAATYSTGTGDACVCGLGEGTAPLTCPLHPPRHSPYGVEVTAEPAAELLYARGPIMLAYTIDATEPAR